jgi:hypothetical protein
VKSDILVHESGSDTHATSEDISCGIGSLVCVEPTGRARIDVCCSIDIVMILL